MLVGGSGTLNSMAVAGAADAAISPWSQTSGQQMCYACVYSHTTTPILRASLALLFAEGHCSPSNFPTRLPFSWLRYSASSPLRLARDLLRGTPHVSSEYGRLRTGTEGSPLTDAHHIRYALYSRRGATSPAVWSLGTPIRPTHFRKTGTFCSEYPTSKRIHEYAGRPGWRNTQWLVLQEHVLQHTFRPERTDR